MRYVYVQDGQVVEGPVMLPVNWKNISNFKVLDNDTLKLYGWYPHRFVEATLGENDKITGSYFVIEETEVIEYQTVATKTESEIQELINQKWINIRSQRAIYLQECDWTQLADVPLSDEKKLEWSTYRQALRDITNYESPDMVIWPEKPSMDDPTYRLITPPVDNVTETPTEDPPVDNGVIDE